MAIMIIFAVYEFLNIKKSLWLYAANFWNLIDLLFIFVYTTYFIMSFYKPENEYALKTL
jgi:hypothetical protein